MKDVDSYAKAVFSLCSSPEKYTDWLKFLKDLETFISVPVARRALNSCLLNKTAKKKLLVDFFAAAINSEKINFIEIIVDNGRLFDVSAILRCLQRLFFECSTELEGVLFSSEPVSDESLKLVSNYLLHKLGKPVFLINQIDPVCDGMKIWVGNYEFDYTVSSLLHQILKIVSKR